LCSRVLTSNLGRHTDYADGFMCLPQLLHANRRNLP
jgi:hypothetical protein